MVLEIMPGMHNSRSDALPEQTPRASYSYISVLGAGRRLRMRLEIMPEKLKSRSDALPEQTPRTPYSYISVLGAGRLLRIRLEIMPLRRLVLVNDVV